jgi:tetratricopeptide (TPR) repeat protein
MMSVKKSVPQGKSSCRKGLSAKDSAQSTPDAQVSHNANLTSRELPGKEATVFKNILKLYEFKQYKKGLKLAETILKKFESHGETLSMKGLFLSQLSRKDEAYECVRRAVDLDPTSHICWHVYGLLHRADKNYADAVKCYQAALNIDKVKSFLLNNRALYLPCSKLTLKVTPE